MKKLLKALSLAAVMIFGLGAMNTASASPSPLPSLNYFDHSYGQNYNPHNVHRRWGSHHRRGHHGRSHARLGHIGYGHYRHRRHW